MTSSISLTVRRAVIQHAEADTSNFHFTSAII
jgi:hypothetical protein